MIFIRARASRKPSSIKKIILPPLFMSTGALMFLFPVFRISWLQTMEALLVGIVCSLFLISTSHFKINGQQIYLIPSKAFIFILATLLAVRLTFKLVFSQTLPLGELSGMFFLLAFGMIASWRIAMVIKFKRLKKELDSQVAV